MASLWGNCNATDLIALSLTAIIVMSEIGIEEKSSVAKALLRPRFRALTTFSAFSRLLAQTHSTEWPAALDLYSQFLLILQYYLQIQINEKEI